MAWVGCLPARSMRVGPEVGDLADLYRSLAAEGQLFGFEATERFYEIGTPQALAETRAFLAALLGRAQVRAGSPSDET